MAYSAERAGDLIGAWINGNRADVLRELSEMTPLRAAVYAAVIYRALVKATGGMGSEGDGADFLRHLDRAAE